MHSANCAHILSKAVPCLDSASGNQPHREEAEDPGFNREKFDVGKPAELLESLPLR